MNRQVNPLGATPILTLDQVWAALELKRTQTKLLLAVIDSFEVLSEDGETIFQEVKFKDEHGVGMGPIIGPEVRERFTHIGPVTASPPLFPSSPSFLEPLPIISNTSDVATTELSSIRRRIFQYLNSASRVLKIVSKSALDDLLLTFSFEWRHPEIKAGNEEAIAKQRQYQAAAPRGVGDFGME